MTDQSNAHDNTQRFFSMDWRYAHEGPVGQCLFKSKLSDFRVNEVLPFDPEGEGEHALLLVEKTGENTDWVAGQLAEYARVKRQSVSYAGRKDRQGVAQQWFCVSLPGKPDPDWGALPLDNVRVLESARHRKKLRTGALKGNRFSITLREVDTERSALEALLNTVSLHGVPNYFGPQRFGHGGQNVQRALALFSGRIKAPRNKRSIYLSAARAWLFNQIVSERVRKQSWNQYLQGDVLGFCRSNSLIFDTTDNTIPQRVQCGDISPTAALWGGGDSMVSGQVAELEQSIISETPELSEGLSDAGLKQERRITRLIPQEMQWRWVDSRTLVLDFYLPKGCFATSVLRELLHCHEGVNNDAAVIK